MRNKVAFAVAWAVIAGLAGCAEDSPSEHLQRAQLLMQKDDLPAAVIELKNAIAKAPDLAEARILLAESYLLQAQLPTAEKEFRRAIELGAPAEKVLPLLLRTLYYMEEFEEIDYLARNAEITDPQNLSHVRYYQFLAGLRGNIEGTRIKATDYFAEMEGQDLIIAQAFEAFIKGQKEQVSDKLASTFDEPHQLEALHLAGMNFYQNEEFDKAAKQFSLLVEKMPVINSVRFLLADSLLKSVNLDAAETQINVLYKASKENPLVNSLKANLEYSRGNYAAALPLAEKAIQNGADTVTTRRIAASSSYALGELERTYRHLANLSERGNLNESMTKLLADVQLRLGYTQTAVSTLEKLGELSGMNANLLAAAGATASIAGDVIKAQELYALADQSGVSDENKRLYETLLRVAKSDQSAIDVFEKVTKEQPELEKGWTHLALLHLSKNEVDKALAVAKQWQELEPASGEVLEGVIWFRQADMGKAETLFKQALEKEPRHVGAMINLIALYAAQEQPQSVIERAEQLLRVAPDNMRAIMALLQASMQLKNMEKSDAILTGLVAANPELIEPTVGLAILKRLQGKVPEAIDLLEKNRYRLNDIGWMTLGDALITARELEKSRSVYAQWRETNSSLLLPWLRQIGAEELTGNLSEALRLSEQAVLKFPGNNRVLLLLAYYQTQSGQLSAAKRSLGWVKQSGIQNPAVTAIEAMIAYEEKDYTKAADLAHSAFYANPNFSNLKLLTRALIKSDRKDDAWKEFDDYIESGKASSSDIYAIADYYTQEAQYARVSTLYKLLLEGDADNLIWLNNLANVLYLQGQFAKALPYAVKANELAPNEPILMDTLGMLLFKNGEVDNALKVLHEAYSKMPQHTETRLHLLEVAVVAEQDALVEEVSKDIDLSEPTTKLEFERIMSMRR